MAAFILAARKRASTVGVLSDDRLDDFDVLLLFATRKARAASLTAATRTNSSVRPSLWFAENDPILTLKRRTRFFYNDGARVITSQSDQAVYGDGVFKGEALYDGLGRTTETRQYETASIYITSLQNYDGLGRVIQTSNPYRPATESLLWTTTVYDGLGRVLTVTTPDNAVVTTTYSGSTTTVRDQASKQRRSIADGLGRVKTVDEMLEFPSTTVYATTSYGYDVLDDLTGVAQIQPSPLVTQTRTYAYNSLKRLKQATNPESGTVNYTYDANSNLETEQDARSITVTYAYDALNRVKSRTYTNDPQNTPAVFYKYDAQTLPAGAPAGFNRGFSTGRLVAATYGTSTSSAGNYMGYDQIGRVTSSFQQTDSQNYGFSYAYNLASEMTSQTYPSGRVVQTEYDGAARLAGVKNQSTGLYWAGASAADTVNRIQYASHGAVSAMKLGNGKWEHTNFNNRLQPSQIGLGASSADSSTLKLDYTYGSTTNNGNVLTQAITIGAGGPTPTTINQSYGYDSVNRLSSATETGAWSQTYDFDRYGNRAIRIGSYIPQPQLTPQSSTPTDYSAFNQGNNRIAVPGFGYDAAGNLTSDPTTVANAMIYDGENRQVSHTKAGVTTTYFYDGDGHRVKKQDSTGTIVFVYNALAQLIAEYHGDPVPPAAGGGGTSYLTSDHPGSTRVVTKQDGSVKARYDYLPFGEELGATVGQRTTGMGYSAPDSTTRKFTQKERDTESGLDCFIARYYSSPQGRFTSTDPKVDERSAIDPQRFNVYVYVRNNPLGLIDPDGKQDKGSGGSKVIDIFIALSNKDFRQGNQHTSFARLKSFGKQHGYTINVHGYNASTYKNVAESLKTAAMTIVDGHGLYRHGDDSKKAYGIQLKDAALTENGKEVNFLGYSFTVADQLTSNVKVLGLFGCNTTYMKPPVVPEGPGMTAMISVDSGAKGETTVPAMTASVQAFVKEYVATGGDTMSALTAGTKALRTGEATNPANKGDKLSLTLLDPNLAPPQELKVPR